MENTNLKPVIRFPEFTDEWEEKRLGDIGKIKSGGTPNRGKTEFWNGSIPWVSTSLINYKNITQTNEFITELGLLNSSAKLFPIDTILMAMYGQGKTRGQVAKLKIEASTNQACAAIILKNIVDNEFIYQILSKNYLTIRNLSNEGGQKNLSSTLIRNFKFIIPNSLVEQKKIADFLTSIDERITLLKEKKATLLDFKKGVMQKIFPSAGSGQAPEIRFKDDNGNDFPDWEEKKLGIVGNTINGLTGKTKEDFGRGKPFIQYTQIFNSSKVNTNDFGLVNIGQNDNQTKVQFGDILFTTSSETPHEVGMSSVLLEEVDELYLNSFSFGFRPNNLKELVPSFAQYLFRSNNVRRNIIKLAQGSTRYNMSKLSFMKQTILLPEEDEQIKIANYLTVLDDKIEAVQQKIDASIDFKKGLLQKMFV